MKAILKFKLPKDEHEFKLATQAENMRDALQEMKEWLRTEAKYAPDTMSEDTYKALTYCKLRFNQILDQYSIEL